MWRAATAVGKSTSACAREAVTEWAQRIIERAESGAGGIVRDGS